MMLYRITSPDDKECVAYTTTLQAADQIAAIIIGNGYRADVRRLHRRDVPMNGCTPDTIPDFCPA